MTTYCSVYPGSGGNGFIQFDMGAEKQVQSLYIAQGHGKYDTIDEYTKNDWEVFVFNNTPAAGNLSSHSGTANHCFTGYLEGFVSCT